MKSLGKLSEKRIVSWLLIALILPVTAVLLSPHHFTIATASYLPLHSAMETFTVLAGMLVFTAGVNNSREKASVNLVLLSSAFLLVGLLGFAHMLSYPGMPDFVTPSDAEKSIYFGLMAQITAAFVLLAVAVLPWQREVGALLRVGYPVAALVLAGAVYWMILFRQPALPQMFDAATGTKPTPFKQGVEYLIVGLYTVAAAIFYRRKQAPQTYDADLLFAAAAVMGLSEFFFVTANIFGTLNFFGHVYKLIAYYLLYAAVFTHAFRIPYRLLTQSEQCLRESEERYRLIVETSAEGIWLIDSYYTTIFANLRMAEMLGYTNAEQMVGHSLLDLMDERHKASAASDMERHHQGVSEQHEFRLRRRNGEEFWARLSTSPIFQDGEYIGALAMVTDITESRRAAQKIADLKRRNELILNAAGEGICGLDEKGIITFANPAAAKMLGYQAEELPGLSLHDVSHHTRPDGSPYPAEECPVLSTLKLGGCQHESDEFYWRRDGSRFPVKYTSTSIIENGRISGAVVVFGDITRKRQMEQTLRESEERFRNIFEHAEIGMMLTSPYGAFLRVNRKFCEIVGYSDDELVWMTFQEITHPEDLGQDIVHLEQVATGEIDTFAMEKRYVRKDGGLIWVNLTVSPIRNKDGSIKHFVAVAEDISGRKRVAQQLRDLSDHLQTVREEEKARIAREIHDDLGGTLTALKMDVYWLLRKLPANEEGTPLIERAELMSQLLDNAVGVTRRVITELRPTILDDLGLLAALEWQSAQFAKRTGIECRVACLADKGQLDKDRSIALFRIFQETLTNVARHAGASCVRVSFYHDDDAVSLRVSDDGCGLNQENRDNLFRYGIRGMVERARSLGGHIGFESPPGGGLTITALLPMNNPVCQEKP
ncbi:MAG: PAS domain S-box protein [Sulfuricella sp.]|nr:PAS domain S-box protein [Sulfuricella sp.]